MSETKKREFSKETARKHLIGIVQRANMLNNGEANHPYPNKINRMTVFGSYLNLATEKINDLDIYLECTNDRQASIDYAHTRPMKGNYVNWLFSEMYERKSWLQNHSNIISLHDPELYGDERAIAFSEDHVCVIENGMVQEQACKRLGIDYIECLQPFAKKTSQEK